VSFQATMTLTVGWGDCDPAGIVFYPNYFRWFDDAAWGLFAAGGLAMDTLAARYDMLGLPLADARASFRAPCRRGDRLEIVSRITAWHRKTLDIDHQVMNGGELAVEGREVRFWGLPHPDRPGRLKAGEIPAEVKAHFEARGQTG
jgi:4-hydroxybenzoyl-CoA thioesterase